MEFKEIQDMWTDKQAPAHLSLQLNREGIIEQLYQLQRKTVFSSLFVSVSFAMVFIVLGMIWNGLRGESWIFDLGATIVFIDMLIALAFMWSLVISWKGKTFDLDSRTFMEKAINRLKRRKFVLGVVIPIYIITLAVGINLTYIHSIQELPLAERVLIHSGMTAALLLGMVFSAFRQRKYVTNKIDPLIGELKQIEESLKED